MMTVLAIAISEYWEFYHQYLLRQWHHMTPMKFAGLLITIAVIGWLLMRNSAKSY